MHQADSILKLLEEGRELEVLSMENKTQSLNQLQHHRLVEVTEGRFHLTQDGREALEMGAEKFVAMKKAESNVLELSSEKKENRGSTLVLSLLLLLLLTLLFFLFNLDTLFG